MRVKCQSLSRVRLFAMSWTVAHHAPLSMGFSRQEYWSGLPCPPPGHLPEPGTEPMSPAGRQILCHWRHKGSFPGGPSGKEPTCQCRRHRDMGLIPGSGNPLKQGTATHSSILAWRITWTEKHGGLQSIGSQRVRHN